MLKRCSAFVLFSVLLATAGSARECEEAGAQLQSAWQQLNAARLGNSEAATEYSSCVQDRGTEECQDKLSIMKSAQDNLKTSRSEYESGRESEIEDGCIDSDEDRQPFGKTRPLGVWPPVDNETPVDNEN
jgi:hypothetical protein